jgi:hypothetical protein
MADQQKPQTVCINDTNGDGDCAGCARNPQAPCRQVPARLPVVDELGELRTALAHHLDPRGCPCQDRGVDYPCDVAEAFADAYRRRAARAEARAAAETPRPPAESPAEPLMGVEAPSVPLEPQRGAQSVAFEGLGTAITAGLVAGMSPDGSLRDLDPTGEWYPIGSLDGDDKLPVPFGQLTADERRSLAGHARGQAAGIAITAGMLPDDQFDAAIERSKRWQAIADGLTSDTREVSSDD